MNKKVIFLIPTLSMGGGERVVSELSLSLPDPIERIIVLFKNEVFYPYKGKLIPLNISLSNNPFFRIYYLFVAVLRFRKIIKAENPDYIISFGVPANIINILSSKKTILRIDTFLSYLPGNIYKFLIKIFYNKSSKIICVSKASAKDLIDNFRIKEEKVKVIYNPLDIKKIQNLALEPLEPEYEKIFDKPVMISIGRLTKGKNHSRLIRTFKEVKNIVKEAQLVILGTGELESDLRKNIKDFGLENDIHLLGRQRNPFKFLAKSKAFVLFSSQEGLPYVILEAMACGLPIISTDCKAGPREILAPETDINKETKDIEYAEFGILIPAFDNKNSVFLTKSEESLKRAMTEILTNKNLADNLAKKSLQRAEDFDIKKIINEWSFLNNEYDKAT